MKGPWLRRFRPDAAAGAFPGESTELLLCTETLGAWNCFPVLFGCLKLASFVSLVIYVSS